MQKVVAALFLLEALLCGLPACLFEAAHVDFKKQKTPIFAADVELRVPSSPAVSKTEVQSEISHPFKSPLTFKTPSQYSILNLFGNEPCYETLPAPTAWNYYYIRTYICCTGEAPSQTGPPSVRI